MENGKIVDFKDGKLLIEFGYEIDPNKDGQALAGIKASVWVDMMEVSDEAISFYQDKFSKKDA